ncbi:MAG: efflux RND transporter permease subunit [Deltaproteobacteria bacterium]|nr:efflux RND transporter permease subunit [Deltaproteobacteria bacterium]
MRLPEFGVRRSITTIMVFLGIVLLGAVSLSKLPVDMLPDIEPPAISVITVYPGAAAADVEDKVTRSIENQLSIVDNLDTITSISAENQSIVTCKFDWGTDLDEASNNIRERLEFAKRLLPDDAEDPIIFKFSTAMVPILFIGFTADESYPRLYQFVDKYIADRLKNVPGVGAVQILGGLERQIQVRLDRQRIQAYRLSVGRIADKIHAEHLDLPAGKIKMGETEYLIRVLGEFEEPYELNNVIVGERNGSLIYLRDVAQVVDTHRERTMFVRVNGRDALLVMVQKQSGTNTVTVAQRVKKRLEELRYLFPKDVGYTINMDASRDILVSIKNLSTTLWWALIAVSAVVLFFLRRTTNSLIIVLTIPFSIIISFIFMYILGITINVMSLSSLIIAMGLVVDNAIVVLDNITRHVEEGERPGEAAIFASSEVGKAITASSLTLAVIFIPLIFMKGLTGIMFKDMAIVITVTILASLFTALTLTPMLSSRLLRKKGKESKKKIWRFLMKRSERIFSGMEEFYGGLLDRALQRKKTTIAIAALLFLSSLALFPIIGTEFMPEEDTSYIRAQLELPVGTRVEETDEVMHKVEEIFRQEVPELKVMSVRSGEEEKSLARAFGSKMGSHIGYGGVRLVDKEDRERSSQEIASVLRKKISRIPGLRRVGVGTQDPMERILMGAGKPISLEVMGHDLEQLSAFALKVKRTLERIPGAVDVSLDYDPGKPEIHIRIDRERAASLGLTVNQIAETMRTNFYGHEAAKFLEAGSEYDIFLRLKEPQRRMIWDIENTFIALLSGKHVKLKNIAQLQVSHGPVEIYRKNQMRVIRVESHVRGRPMGDVAKDLDRALTKMQKPPGIMTSWGGEVEEQRKSFRALFLLLGLGVILVYMVMASVFESLLHPFIIMFSIPFLFIGVLLFLLLGGSTFNMVSLIGMIMLVGIVVNNGIVLVDYINLMRARGLGLLEAIRTGGRRRLRPVLMTTLTTMGCAFTMIVSRGEGSEAWRPLGLTVFGGLLTSTLITLIFVPTLYYFIERRREARKK